MEKKSLSREPVHTCRICHADIAQPLKTASVLHVANMRRYYENIKAYVRDIPGATLHIRENTLAHEEYLLGKSRSRIIVTCGNCGNGTRVIVNDKTGKSGPGAYKPKPLPKTATFELPVAVVSPEIPVVVANPPAVPIRKAPTHAFNEHELGIARYPHGSCA